MAQTLIRGNTQIMAGTITDTQISASAAIASSKLADGANFLKKDGTVAMTAALNAGSFRITNVADPSTGTDACNYQTAQALINGVAIKPAVRAVASANTTLTGTQTIDGVSLVANDRVLLTAQSTAAQNGVWLVQAGSWTRPTDFAAASVQKAGIMVLVAEGTTYHDTKWLCITDGSITVDTTSTVWNQDTSGTTYTNGSGLSLTGNTFAVKYGNGIQADGSNNVSAKAYATRLITVDANGIGITDGTGGQLVVANGSGNAAWATLSGDATLSNAGAITINTTSGSGFLKYGAYVSNETPTGSINGSNTSFTLANTPIASTMQLYYNGQLMEQGAGNDYTISGSAITMLFTPQTGDKLKAYYWK